MSEVRFTVPLSDDAEVWIDGRYIKLDSLGHQIVLDAQEGLALLNWLTRHKGELDKLAKEQAKP